jgi:hypothetical protein
MKYTFSEVFQKLLKTQECYENFYIVIFCFSWIRHKKKKKKNKKNKKV